MVGKQAEEGVSEQGWGLAPTIHSHNVSWPACHLFCCVVSVTHLCVLPYCLFQHHPMEHPCLLQMVCVAGSGPEQVLLRGHAKLLLGTPAGTDRGQMARTVQGLMILGDIRSGHLAALAMGCTYLSA